MPEAVSLAAASRRGIYLLAVAQAVSVAYWNGGLYFIPSLSKFKMSLLPLPGMSHALAASHVALH